MWPTSVNLIEECNSNVTFKNLNPQTYEVIKMPLIFWLGVGLLIVAALVLAACCFTCIYHQDDHTGTSGGFDGIEICCIPIAGLTFLLGGIFCMVGTHTWTLIISIICNIISVPVHIITCYGCTGWKAPSENASEIVNRLAKTAFIRIIPENCGHRIVYCSSGCCHSNPARVKVFKRVHTVCE